MSDNKRFNNTNKSTNTRDLTASYVHYPQKKINSDIVFKLFAIVTEGDMSKINNFVVENNIGYDVKNDKGDSLLHALLNSTKNNNITKSQQLNIAKFLISNGVNPNSKNNQNITPLHIASKYNLTKFINLLIENGADINYKDNYGMTPLHYFVQGDLHVCVNNRLSKRIENNTNIKNNDIITILNSQYFLKYVQYIENLIKNINYENINNVKNQYDLAITNITYNSSDVKRNEQKYQIIKDRVSDIIKRDIKLPKSNKAINIQANQTNKWSPNDNDMKIMEYDYNYHLTNLLNNDNNYNVEYDTFVDNSRLFAEDYFQYIINLETSFRNLDRCILNNDGSDICVQINQLASYEYNLIEFQEINYQGNIQLIDLPDMSVTNANYHLNNFDALNYNDKILTMNDSEYINVRLLVNNFDQVQPNPYTHNILTPLKLAMTQIYCYLNIINQTMNYLINSNMYNLYYDVGNIVCFCLNILQWLVYQKNNLLLTNNKCNDLIRSFVDPNNNAITQFRQLFNQMNEKINNTYDHIKNIFSMLNKFIDYNFENQHNQILNDFTFDNGFSLMNDVMNKKLKKLKNLYPSFDEFYNEINKMTINDSKIFLMIQFIPKNIYKEYYVYYTQNLLDEQNPSPGFIINNYIQGHFPDTSDNIFGINHDINVLAQIGVSNNSLPIDEYNFSIVSRDNLIYFIKYFISQNMINIFRNPDEYNLQSSSNIAQILTNFNYDNQNIKNIIIGRTTDDILTKYIKDLLNAKQNEIVNEIIGNEQNINYPEINEYIYDKKINFYSINENEGIVYNINNDKNVENYCYKKQDIPKQLLSINNINIADNNNFTPIYYAIMLLKSELVKQLVNNNSVVTNKKYHKYNKTIPLNFAINMFKINYQMDYNYNLKELKYSDQFFDVLKYIYNTQFYLNYKNKHNDNQFNNLLIKYSIENVDFIPVDDNYIQEQINNNNILINRINRKINNLRNNDPGNNDIYLLNNYKSTLENTNNKLHNSNLNIQNNFINNINSPITKSAADYYDTIVNLIHDNNNTTIEDEYVHYNNTWYQILQTQKYNLTNFSDALFKLIIKIMQYGNPDELNIVKNVYNKYIVEFINDYVHLPLEYDEIENYAYVYIVDIIVHVIKYTVTAEFYNELFDKPNSDMYNYMMNEMTHNIVKLILNNDTVNYDIFWNNISTNNTPILKKYELIYNEYVNKAYLMINNYSKNLMNGYKFIKILNILADKKSQ